MKIVFCTQNMAPFRMKWMDEIAKYHSVIIYHLNEYEVDQNLNYISYTPKRAVVKCFTKKIFGGKIGFCDKKIIDEEADLYILDGYGFPGQLALMLKFKQKKISFLMSIDGGFIKKDESFYKRFIKSFFISMADGYLSTSELTDEYIDFYGGKGKVKYRHLFSNIMNDDIENEPLQYMDKLKLKTELGMKKTFSIITVGKAQYVKGFDLLINAAKKLDRECDIYLIGVSDKTMYMPLIKKNIESRIHFIHFCDSQTLKKYYQAADLFILPTRGDVWGLVISEAMSNGICVVTTNRCLAGVAMLEKEEIIASEDIEQLCNAILYHMNLSEEERREIGQRNINKVKKYSIENAAIADVKHLEDYTLNKKDNQ